MTKTVKIIWTTAALLGAVSLFFNFREIPQETPPPLKNGEFLCPPDKQAEADRLKPPRHTAEEIGGYARLIEKRPFSDRSLAAGRRSPEKGGSIQPPGQSL